MKKYSSKQPHDNSVTLRKQHTLIIYTHTELVDTFLCIWGSSCFCQQLEVNNLCRPLQNLTDAGRGIRGCEQGHQTAHTCKLAPSFSSTWCWTFCCETRGPSLHVWMKSHHLMLFPPDRLSCGVSSACLVICPDAGNDSSLCEKATHVWKRLNVLFRAVLLSYCMKYRRLCVDEFVWSGEAGGGGGANSSNFCHFLMICPLCAICYKLLEGAGLLNVQSYLFCTVEGTTFTRMHCCSLISSWRKSWCQSVMKSCHVAECFFFFFWIYSGCASC